MGRIREENEKKNDQSEKKKSQKKEDAGARKCREVAKHFVFTTFCGSSGLKCGRAKAAGAEPSGEMRDEKLHANVARSTFQSQNCEKLFRSEHLWKLRCRKSARSCSVKHISKNVQNISASERLWKLSC